jgi:hypothetical protein
MRLTVEEYEPVAMNKCPRIAGIGTEHFNIEFFPYLRVRHSAHCGLYGCTASLYILIIFRAKIENFVHLALNNRSKSITILSPFRIGSLVPSTR